MARKIRIECQTRFMKWLLGTYTSRFNRRHRLFGHLFSGRYKALVVDGRGNVCAHGVRCASEPGAGQAAEGGAAVAELPVEQLWEYLQPAGCGRKAVRIVGEELAKAGWSAWLLLV